MAQLNAYVRFNGNCKEAFEFYQSCFGGDLKVQTVGESPMAAQWSPDTHNRVLHAELKSGTLTLLGSDMIGTDAPVVGNVISLCLVCSSKEEIEAYFKNLSTGANVTNDLRSEFFGTYGDLVDKFGLSWMLQFGMS
ncbi:MAG: VOC family protein [Chloroflexi bacterium]|nr:VOC family protein [Chloroflexota bacterium]MCC6892949.1 VOC family protein [Anaerolineae bacterium]